MKLFIFILLGLLLSGCGTKKIKRTRYTDPVMRIMIDPDSVKAEDYINIQEALFNSGKWEVVDRSHAFDAIKKEQERQHRRSFDRFSDKEKWAHWGQLYGVRGVVVGQTKCMVRKSAFYWLVTRYHNFCKQNLAIYDANTGELLAAVKHDAMGEHEQEDLPVNWDNTVELLNQAFPKYFKRRKLASKLKKYQQLSKERAIRQKEKVAKRKALQRLRQLNDDERYHRYEIEKTEALGRALTGRKAPSQPQVPQSLPAGRLPQRVKPNVDKILREELKNKGIKNKDLRS